MSWNTSSSTISASHRRLDRPNGSTTLELRTNAKQRAQRDRASTGSDERDTNDLRADACGSTSSPSPKTVTGVRLVTLPIRGTNECTRGSS